jgi:hypothetical protein
MFLFFLHLHKVVAHPALCRDNRYLQIGRHQAYAVGSCVERSTQEVDVRTVRIQMVPALVMNPIIKPWPFRGWGMDMIDKINRPSSKGHQYILAIMDYFTKWVEAIPMKTVTSKDVINFIKEHVIQRFGIPQTIMTDGGSIFISEEFRKFAANVGIKLIRSSPYYA